ncbi:MAG: 16S rRNA pseudouridine(516) synthase, partial [Neisseriaceae bacterium]|nr:16S rRNA pseudouridine(516) synthase [Neisseriaceae bacterium]
AELRDEHTLLMTITEGRYHQVKRMIAAAGNRVEQLHRLSFGEFELGDTPVGSWHFVVPTTLASEA